MSPMPTRSDLTTAFLRTFAIQGSWNYRTLVGGGLAYAMLPLLLRIHAGNPVALAAALRRHASSFNGHPYLCPMAVGALARVEQDGLEPEKIERFRTALRGPLGAVGDRVVWAGWRPLCFLLAIIGFGLGLEAWKAALIFLLVYNAGHLWLRLWGYRRGWQEGLNVGAVLTRSTLKRIAGPMMVVNQFLLGLATVAVVLTIPGLRGIEPFAGVVAVAVAATVGVGGFLKPGRISPVSVFLLLMAGAVWFG